MTNEANQDAEESRAIEKTATEQSNSSAAANAAAIEPQALEQPAAEVAEAPADTAPAADPQQAPAEEAPPSDAAPAGETDAEAQSIEWPGAAAETPQPVDSATAEPRPEPISEPAAQAVPVDPVEQTPPARTQNRTVKAPPKPIVETPPADEPAASGDEPAASGDIDFGAILEQFEQEQTVFHAGELVTGTIIGKSDRGVMIDFGYKSEGFVPLEEFSGPDGDMPINVGEEIEVIIRSIHAGEGAPQLSRMDALGRKVWDEIEAAFNSETPITGRVVDKTKGGLRIDIKGVEAFLPGSQIDSRPIRGLDSYIGQDIEAKIIKFSRRRNNIVMSRKVITDEVVNVQKTETMSRIEIGYVVDGTIKNLTEYGAFVDIGGIDGLLHVTDMSWGRIHHPADQFKVGEHIQVKILKLDREKEKISLGFKQLLPDPWSTVVEVYPVNTKLKGIVSSVTEYGVFVELEAGVEGLVHVSEISWSRRSQSPKRMFHKGQEVEVQVLGVDTVEKRISLGMKQFQENPWDMVDIKYPVGAKIIGRVRNLTDFGAFIELEEGIDGLVHVSDISWAKKIKHPKDVLKKDQEVEAIVTSIDKRGQRLSLSMKDLTPSAWEGFVATHRPGDVVRGKVSRFTNFGVFVELGDGLEGLCHISELSDERVDRAESVAELGQEMDFKILRIEPAEQKIGLSHRAVGKVDEPVVDTKMYSTEAKGGMASLSELANLKFGAPAETPVADVDPDEKKKAKQAAKKAKADQFAAKEAEAAAKSGSEDGSEVAEQESDAAESATAAETPESSDPVAKAQPASEEESAPAAKEQTEESSGAESEAVASEAPREEAVPADDSAADGGNETAARGSTENKSAEDNTPGAKAAAGSEAASEAEASPTAEPIEEPVASDVTGESAKAAEEAETADQKENVAEDKAAPADEIMGAPAAEADESEPKADANETSLETDKKKDAGI